MSGLQSTRLLSGRGSVMSNMSNVNITVMQLDKQINNYTDSVSANHLIPVKAKVADKRINFKVLP